MDPAVVFWFVVVPACVLGVLGIRLYQSRVDADRRRRARAHYDAREAERHRDQFFDEVDRFFPFIREPFRERVDNGQAPEEAFLDALDEVPATRIGTTIYDLPALLPLAERRKHLYVVGKTGSGKTSLLLHLIRSDLLAGRGVGVIAPEAELFRDWLLPLVPEERAHDVVYFAPGYAENPVTFNPLAIEPGDDQGRAAGELFAIFKRVTGDEGLGARMAPIVGNAFAALTGRPGATLWDVKRLLEDQPFREQVAAETCDPYLREVLLKAYPSYPRGSHLPVVNRLDQFLRPQPIRQALTNPTSSFSFRAALARGQILFFDLSRLAPDSMLLLGQMLLSKFQLELMRREAVPAEERAPFHLYADEFATFAGVAEGTWRELLSRGRRYGLALTVANQFPAQLPQALQDEIFGNVASIVAFNLGAKDAHAVRRELLDLPLDGSSAAPVAAEVLVGLKVGQAMARLGGGAFALRVNARPPLDAPPPERGHAVREQSWRTYAAQLPPPSRVIDARQLGREEIEDEVID